MRLICQKIKLASDRSPAPLRGNVASTKYQTWTAVHRPRSAFFTAQLFLLLLAFFAMAQSPPPFRLEASPPLARSESTPVLDQTGVCLGWLETSRSTLLDAQGRMLAKSDGKILKHAISSDGSAFAVLEKTTSSKDRMNESFFTIRCFNRGGQQSGLYNFSQHRDDPVPQIIFNAASSPLLVAYPATARLIFLNQNGQVLRESFLFHEAPYSNERPLFMAASANAFIVLSQKTPSTNASTVAPTLICFSNKGEEQWRRELPMGTAGSGSLAMSDDGAWIAAGRYAVTGARVESTISIFNSRGELQSKTEGLFRRAFFAKNGNGLLLMDRRQLRALDFRRGNTLWLVNLTRRAEMFVDVVVDAMHNKTFALVAENVFKENRFIFEKARLLGFDAAGQQQLETLLPVQLNAPMLKISNDGGRLTLAAEGFLQNFTVSPSSK